MPDKVPLTAEDVAYWYLRLNGFLMLKNFLVHGDIGGDPRTDIDVLGVRFRFRREHLAQPMFDDGWVEEEHSTIVVFCDAKKGAQDFNSTWWQREKKIMEHFLALVGVLPQGRWQKVAEDLYENGFSRRARSYLITTLLVYHDQTGLVDQFHWPHAQRIQIRDALRFIHLRFNEYANVKSDHGQWMPSGHRLWDLYKANRNDLSDFTKTVLREIGADSSGMA